MKRVVIGSVLLGGAVAGFMTWQDWRLNPGELFRGSEGTHWKIVAETVWSWFWPVTTITCVFGISLSVAIRRFCR